MKKRVTLLTALLFIIGFMILAGVQVNEVRDEVGGSQTPIMIPIGPIVKGDTVQESIHLPSTQIDFVRLLMATYGRQNSADISVVIALKHGGRAVPTWTIVRTVRISTQNFQDNSYHTFEFPLRSVRSEDVLQITLTSDNGTPNNAVTAWMTEGQPLRAENPDLYISGKRMNGYIPYQVGVFSQIPLWQAMNQISTNVPIRGAGVAMWILLILAWLACLALILLLLMQALQKGANQHVELPSEVERCLISSSLDFRGSDG